MHPHPFDQPPESDIDYKQPIQNKNLEAIEKSLSDTFKIFKNFKIGNYYVDLYLEEFNLVIDQIHLDNNFDIESDDYKLNFIKSELACEIIRFNPYSSNFSIFMVIGSIFKYILSQKTKQLIEKDHKIKLLKDQF
jgi:very-short-patch-repair endonuclease